MLGKLDRNLFILLVCAATGAVFFAYLVASMWLMPFRFYAACAGVCSVVLLPLTLFRRTRAKLFVCGWFLLALLYLWGVPWSPRKAFFQNVWFIREGVTVQQVEARMASWTADSAPWAADPALYRVARPIPRNFSGTLWYHLDPRPSDQYIQVRFQNGRVAWVGYNDD